MEIKKIKALETFLVRHPVLRNGKPIESCYFDGDDLDTTQHFGLFYDEKLVGVASIFEKQNPLFSNTKQYQLRGMAVLSNYQKQAFGQSLIKHCESIYLKTTGVIWFNARENAVPFYQKQGYKIIGDAFMIDGVGIHFLMKKEK